MPFYWILLSVAASPAVTATGGLDTPSTTAQQHIVTYNDCYNPSATATYTSTSFCPRASVYAASPPPTPPQTRYQVLTPTIVRHTTGFRCQRRGSTITGYCGAYSHFKWAEVPTFQAEETMTGEECRKLAREQKIVIQGTAVDVAVNAITSFRYTPTGRILVDHTVPECEGEQRKAAGQVVGALLTLKEVTISLQEIKFSVSQEGKMHDTSYSTSLPTSCTVSLGSCEGSYTYTWDIPTNQCPFETIRTIYAYRDGNLIVAQGEALLFNVTSSIRRPDCEGIELMLTSLQNIALTVSTTLFPVVATENEDVYEENLPTLQFAIYSLENQGRETAESEWDGLSCINMLNAATPGVIVPFHELFLRRQGEIVQLLSCPKHACRVEPQNYCTIGLPCRTEEGTLLFIDSLTRVGHPKGVRRPCSALLDPAVRTQTGVWVKVGRSVQEIGEPASYPRETVHIPAHLQLKGGLYTPEELSRWEAMLTFPTYHEAAAVEMSLQECQSENCLGMHTSGFSPSEEEESLWKKVEGLFDPLRWIDDHRVGILLVTLIYVILALVGKAIALLFVIQDQGARAGRDYLIRAVIPPAGPIIDRRDRRHREERMRQRDRELQLMM